MQSTAWYVVSKVVPSKMEWLFTCGLRREHFLFAKRQLRNLKKPVLLHNRVIQLNTKIHIAPVSRRHSKLVVLRQGNQEPAGFFSCAINGIKFSSSFWAWGEVRLGMRFSKT